MTTVTMIQSIIAVMLMVTPIMTMMMMLWM